MPEPEDLTATANTPEPTPTTLPGTGDLVFDLHAARQLQRPAQIRRGAGTANNPIGLMEQMRTVRTPRGTALETADTFRMPVNDEDVETVEKELTPFDAIQVLNEAYGITLDKKGLVSSIREEVIIRDPDPVNPEEEEIINVQELADELTILELARYGTTPEDDPEKYSVTQAYYLELAKKHKRKLNA